MDETIKQNIMKVVIVVIMFILLLCTITAKSKYNKLEKEIDGYKYEITLLEEDKKEKETLIESYKKTQAEDKETISTLNETVDNLETKVDDLTAKNTSLNKEVTKLQTELDTSNKTITSLNETIKKLNTANDNNLLTIQDLSKQLEESNNKVVTLTTSNTSLNDKLTEVEEKYNTVTKYHVVNSEIELIDALKEGGNILLNTDILMTNNVTLTNKYASIDLRGHNLVLSTIELNETNLELKDSSLVQGKLSTVGDNEYLVNGIKVNENSYLRITNGNYEGKNLFQIKDNASLYVVSGNFNNKIDEIIIKEPNAIVEVLEGTFQM